MEQGLCARCATPYRPADLAGFGILRARAAGRGGPLLEYACPSCGYVMRFVPHGAGRYARPGEPPPPEIPWEERRPPWLGTAPDVGGDAGQAPPPEPAAPAADTESPGAPGPPPPSAVPLDPGSALREALALLGVGAAATVEEIQAAFRERSLTCHPDKVAHLDLEIREVAERKFLRLRAARDLLCGE